MSKIKFPKEPADMVKFYRQALVNSAHDSFYAQGWDKQYNMINLADEANSYYCNGRWSLRIPRVVVPKLSSFCGDLYTPTYAFEGFTDIMCNGEVRYSIKDMAGGHQNTESLLRIINDIEHILAKGVDEKYLEDSYYADPDNWDGIAAGNESMGYLAAKLIGPDLKEFYKQLPLKLRKKWKESLEFDDK